MAEHRGGAEGGGRLRNVSTEEGNRLFGLSRHYLWTGIDAASITHLLCCQWNAIVCPGLNTHILTVEFIVTQAIIIQKGILTLDSLLPLLPLLPHEVDGHTHVHDSS